MPLCAPQLEAQNLLLLRGEFFVGEDSLFLELGNPFELVDLLVSQVTGRGGFCFCAFSRRGRRGSRLCLCSLGLRLLRLHLRQLGFFRVCLARLVDRSTYGSCLNEIASLSSEHPSSSSCADSLLCQQGSTTVPQDAQSGASRVNVTAYGQRLQSRGHPGEHVF